MKSAEKSEIKQTPQIMTRKRDREIEYPVQSEGKN